VHRRLRIYLLVATATLAEHLLDGFDENVDTLPATKPSQRHGGQFTIPVLRVSIHA